MGLRAVRISGRDDTPGVRTRQGREGREELSPKRRPGIQSGRVSTGPAVRATGKNLRWEGGRRNGPTGWALAMS